VGWGSFTFHVKDTREGDHNPLHTLTIVSLIFEIEYRFKGGRQGNSKSTCLQTFSLYINPFAYHFIEIESAVG
jgi:hypothetical protein